MTTLSVEFVDCCGLLWITDVSVKACPKRRWSRAETLADTPLRGRAQEDGVKMRLRPKFETIFCAKYIPEFWGVCVTCVIRSLNVSVRPRWVMRTSKNRARMSERVMPTVYTLMVCRASDSAPMPLIAIPPSCVTIVTTFSPNVVFGPRTDLAMIITREHFGPSNKPGNTSSYRRSLIASYVACWGVFLNVKYLRKTLTLAFGFSPLISCLLFLDPSQVFAGRVVTIHRMQTFSTLCWWLD